MSKEIYTDYVTHCLRHYARFPDKQPESSVDRANWLACKQALTEFTSGEQEMLIAIYRERDTVADNVYQTAKDRGIDQDRIWKLVKALERKVAIYRGLKTDA